MSVNQPHSDGADRELPRLFKTGATQIVEDENLRGSSIEDARNLLRVSYPEVANAAVREYDQDGYHVVEFLARAGTKG